MEPNLLNIKMGITIEQYRSRIGSFLPSKYQTKSRNSLVKYGVKSTNYPRFSLVVLSLLLVSTIVFTSVALTSVQSRNQTYNHPVYPSFSGEDSSTLTNSVLISPAKYRNQGGYIPV